MLVVGTVFKHCDLSSALFLHEWLVRCLTLKSFKDSSSTVGKCISCELTDVVVKLEALDFITCLFMALNYGCVLWICIRNMFQNTITLNQTVQDML